MNRLIKTTQAAAVMGFVMFSMPLLAVAFPGRGSGCASCHNSAGGMAMTTSPNPIDIKKGDNGLLTFQVTSMGNASNANISVQGLQNPALAATIGSGGNQWTLRTGSSGTSYVSNSINSTGPYTLDLAIGAAATTGTYPITVDFSGDGLLGTTSSFNLMISPAGVPGDYNGNGIVDAADYVLWRNGGPLQNQVDDPGTVNAADYTAWRTRFGNAAGTGSFTIALVAVPEPASVVIMTLGVLSMCTLPRRRH